MGGLSLCTLVSAMTTSDRVHEPVFAHIEHIRGESGMSWRGPLIVIPQGGEGHRLCSPSLSDEQVVLILRYEVRSAILIFPSSSIPGHPPLARLG